MQVFEMSMMGSMLIVLLILIRSLFLYQIPKRAFVLLWGIVLLRLLIPFSVPVRGWQDPAALAVRLWQTSVWNMPEQAKGRTAERGDGSPAAYHNENVTAADGADGSVEKIGAQPDGGMAAEHIRMLYAIWAAGMAAVGIWFGAAYRRGRQVAEQSFPYEDARMRQILAGSPKVRRVIRLRISDRILTPFTWKLQSPQIVLPKGISAYGEKETVCMLLHEKVHISRMDGLWKAAAAAALIVHWFNPLVWAMYVLLMRDLELSCDEKVLSLLGEQERETYALTLLTAAEKRMQLAPFGNAFGSQAVKERIEAIMKFKKLKKWGIAAAVLVAMCSLTVFAQAETEKTETKTEKTETMAVKMKKEGAEKAESVYVTMKETEETENNKMIFWGDGVCFADDAEGAGMDSIHVETAVTDAVETEAADGEEIAVEEAVTIEMDDTAGAGGNTAVWKAGKAESEKFAASVTEAAGTSEEVSEEAVYMVRFGEETQSDNWLADWVSSLERYGVSLDEETQQLYYEKEPAGWLADNDRGDEKEFCGKVFSNTQKSKKGVVVERDAKGEITGVRLLDETEAQAYRKGKW